MAITLAMVSRMPRPSDPSPAPIGYVTAFFVEERYRNAGVGGALLAAMNAAAPDDGLLPIHLCATPIPSGTLDGLRIQV